MKPWKKQLRRELDDALPERLQLPENLFRRETGNAAARPTLRRRGLIAVAACLASALVLSAVVSFLIPRSSPLPAVANSCVAVEINPKAAFVTDESGKVIQCVALNEEADILLSAEDFLIEIVGLPLKEAIETYADRAARMGFVDLDRASAIRVSAVEENFAALEEAERALTEYFKQKGAYTAVAKKRVSETELKDLMGIDCGIREFIAHVSSFPVYYTRRVVSELSEDEREAHYEREVVYGKIKEGVRLSIAFCLSDIENLSSLFPEMCDFNEQITAHPDNPVSVLSPVRDYWAVKRRAEGGYSGVFGELMAGMDSLCLRYKQITGREISSGIELKYESNLYGNALEVVTIEQLSSFADDLTDRAFDFFGKYMFDLLETLRPDISRLKALAVIPDTVEKYLANAFEAMSMQARLRLNAWAEIYDRARESLTETEYADFLREITEKYGSVNAYYDAMTR